MQHHFYNPPAPAAHALGWGFVPPAATMAPHRAPQTAAAPPRHAGPIRPNIAAIPMATPAVQPASKAREGEGRERERRETERREREEDVKEEERASEALAAHPSQPEEEEEEEERDHEAAGEPPRQEEPQGLAESAPAASAPSESPVGDSDEPSVPSRVVVEAAGEAATDSDRNEPAPPATAPLHGQEEASIRDDAAAESEPSDLAQPVPASLARPLDKHQLTGAFFFNERVLQLRGSVDGTDAVIRLLVPNKLRKVLEKAPLKNDDATAIQMLKACRCLEDEAQLLHRIGDQLKLPRLLSRGYVREDEPMTLKLWPMDKDKRCGVQGEGEPTELEVRGVYYAVELLKFAGEDALNLWQFAVARAATTLSASTSTPLVPPAGYELWGSKTWSKTLSSSMMSAVASTSREVIHRGLLDALKAVQALHRRHSFPPLPEGTELPDYPLSPIFQKDGPKEYPRFRSKVPSLWERGAGAVTLVHGDMHAANLMVTGDTHHIEVKHIDHECVRELNEDPVAQTVNPAHVISTPLTYVPVDYFLSRARGEHYPPRWQGTDTYGVVVSVAFAALAGHREMAGRLRGWGLCRGVGDGLFVNTWMRGKCEMTELLDTAGKQEERVREKLVQKGLAKERETHGEIMSTILTAAREASEEELLDLNVAKACFTFIAPQEDPYKKPLDDLIDEIETMINRAYPGHR
ncbi:unnamed protein product [Vitrella brassicaformis CCMP3155]|uniref:Uncharacterized protein n=2 Tax=Vitrella brassicaformis TaxID=1169539 RepID=A0A0G4EGZ9_VITBC|nr:unnamed protein product [Vitrella brassicaformis CCMP3155]|eukprot:CEL95744.1 unnamed protein product [Vitrella brassicaformis CCMP3155]